MTPALAHSLQSWLPELILSAGALVVLVAGVFGRKSSAPSVATWVTVLAAACALAATAGQPPGEQFFGMILVDGFSAVFRWLALGTVAIVALMAVSADDVSRDWRGEYLSLLLLIGVGLMLMAEANHLLVAYVAMELVSLGSYALVGLVRDARASEASLKYLLFGALCSGIMLFGISLLFGLTGALSLPGIREAAAALSPQATKALAVTVALVLAGLAFKISMAPFHMWTPDAYEGAPIPVTAMLSVGPKAAGLALLMRLVAALAPVWPSIAPVFTVLTIVTMTLGNLVALNQTNIKRLLAYSTIGQVGYMLIGLCAHNAAGTQAIQVYLVAYLFMNLGAFACVVAVWNQTRSESIEAFRGLSVRSPLLAALLTIFLLSLAGIPPLIGFVGKFFLFGSAIQAQHIALAIAGAVNSAIALYYYVNIVRAMYLTAPDARQGPSASPAWSLRVALGICGIATICLGLFPGALLAWLGVVA